VIAVASSALFDLAEADAVFRERGEAEYRKFQREHENDFLAPGVAFPFVKRLLQLNQYLPEHAPVEVILLSRNDPDTGLRVFKSIEHYQLAISRAAFVSGRNPFRYVEPFNASLFLSGNRDDVRAAIEAGLPAGLVFHTEFADDLDEELRIAFDFDGVLADDSAERVFQSGKLPAFHTSESEKRSEAIGEGPLKRFFSEIARLQQLELDKHAADSSYQPRIRTAIITARNAPAHERVITTLRHWGIQVDEAFFLGGIDKSRVLRQFKPHLFFDDQVAHLEAAAEFVPSVHIPFGIRNQPELESASPREDERH